MNIFSTGEWKTNISPYFVRGRGIFVGSCQVDVVDLTEGCGYAYGGT